MKPIFLISLPRSGSTLLQRIMMGHPQIASKTESWLMLPLVYMMKKEGLLSEYNQRDAHYALVDFIKELPGNQQDYFQSLHDFAISLYAKQSNGRAYFLEKTPRYYLIVKELKEIFPEAKFIFLVRNPLQIIASIITTFKLQNIHFYFIDLLKGFSQMVEGMQHLRGQSIIVRYEDIVGNYAQTIHDLFHYLELDSDLASQALLDDRGLNGRFGDKKGTYQYQKIEDHSINKWKVIFHDVVLKKFASDTINGISSETLELYGYKKNQLLDELGAVNSFVKKTSVANFWHLTASKVIKRYKLNLYRKRIRNWSKEIVIN